MSSQNLLEAARAEGRVRVSLSMLEGDLVLRVYQPTNLTLSEQLPIIDNFGILVSDEWSSEEDGTGGVDNFRVASVPGVSTEQVLARAERLAVGLEAVFAKKMASDPLNKLVLRANLAWEDVDLVRAYVGAEGTPFSLATKGAGRPKAELVNGAFAAGNFSGWQSSGDAFALVKNGDGDWSVTSHVLPKGVKTVGKLWQDFTVDAATGELRFWVRGGQASVRLLRGEEVIRETRGRNTNATETLVRWHLETLRGQTLRVQIEDDLTDTWGFIAARGFELL